MILVNRGNLEFFPTFKDVFGNELFSVGFVIDVVFVESRPVSE